jgi:hypothetical protein
MHLKSTYKMRRHDWHNLVEANGGTILGSRHRTDSRLNPAVLPTAVRLPAAKTRGGFKFTKGKLTRTNGRGR